MTASQPEANALPQERSHVDFEALRLSLPLLDPDRHALDTVDVACARLAPTSGGTA